MGDDLFFAALELADKGLIAGFFVARGPEDHFGEDGREVDSFCGEKVNLLASIGGIRFRGDDAGSFEAAEAVSENVGGDFFVRAEEFLEGFEAPNHHVAKDEKGPAVAEHFDGSVQGTRRAAMDEGLPVGHARNIKSFTCIMQVNIAECGAPFLSNT